MNPTLLFDEYCILYNARLKTTSFKLHLNEQGDIQRIKNQQIDKSFNIHMYIYFF